MVLTNCEFFTFEDEVWCRLADGSTSKMTEKDVDLVRSVDEMISTFYPEAYKMLKDMYKASSANILYHRFLIVSRFIRCNLSNLDHVPDISVTDIIALESVPCPLRGECQYDGIVCRPSFDHNLSSSELRVMELLYQGDSESDIAGKLFRSILTVRTHIRNALRRLGLHSRAEFMRYAAQKKIFDGKVQ